MFNSYQLNVYIIHTVVIVCTGDHTFDISASDPDNDPLTYKLFGLQASVFAVDSATGRVTLNGALDREVCCVRETEFMEEKKVF